MSGKAIIVHVKSAVTGKLHCGRKVGVGDRRSPFAISSTEYLYWLGYRNVAESIKLRFGESARLCDRCRRAA